MMSSRGEVKLADLQVVCRISDQNSTPPVPATRTKLSPTAPSVDEKGSIYPKMEASAPPRLPPPPYNTSSDGSAGIVRTKSRRFRDVMYNTLDQPNGRPSKYPHLLRISLLIMLLGGIVTALGVVCLLKASEYSYYHAPIWGGLIAILTAICMCIASRTGSINLVITTLICCVLTTAVCFIMVAFAAQMWQTIGFPDIPHAAITDYNKKVSDLTKHAERQRMGVTERQQYIEHNAPKDYSLAPTFCVLPRYLPVYIEFIYTTLGDNVDYRECVTKLKIGMAVNSVAVVLGSILGLLSIIAAFVCLKRLCEPCRKS